MQLIFRGHIYNIEPNCSTTTQNVPPAAPRQLLFGGRIYTLELEAQAKALAPGQAAYSLSY